MLGRFRKKITKQTIEMVRQPYALFQSNYGIPAGFWQDEFVLGFFGGMIGGLSKLIGEGRLSQMDKGYLLQNTFSNLSNMNGAVIARNLSDLAHENLQRADFVRGADAGEIITLIFLGKVSDTGRDIVEGIGDHQFDASEPAAGEGAQEVGPEGLGLARPDSKPEDLAAAFRVGADGDDDGGRDDASGATHLDVGRIEPE